MTIYEAARQQNDLEFDIMLGKIPGAWKDHVSLVVHDRAYGLSVDIDRALNGVLASLDEQLHWEIAGVES